MAFNVHQLHIFYTVAEKGSFSQAAQALFMTQPAVTMQVQALETYFGTRLFHRIPKKIELTDAGRALLPFARKGVELIRETEAAMSLYSEKLEALLQLGASLTVGEYVLPRLLGPFCERHPELSVRMKVTNTQQIVDDILAHHLHFGLVEAEVAHPLLHTEPVLQDELVIVLPPGHPLEQQTQIKLADVTAYPFVLREAGSGTRQVMEEQLRMHGVNPETLDVTMELGSTGAVKSAVEAGLGISVLSISSLRHERKLGVLKTRTLEDVTFRRHFYAVYLASAVLPMPVNALLCFLRDPECYTLI